MNFQIICMSTILESKKINRYHENGCKCGDFDLAGFFVFACTNEGGVTDCSKSGHTPKTTESDRPLSLKILTLSRDDAAFPRHASRDEFFFFFFSFLGNFFSATQAGCPWSTSTKSASLKVNIEEWTNSTVVCLQPAKEGVALLECQG